MSVKHIKDYYNQVCDSYNEMIEIIKELEEEMQTSMVEPERVDKLKEMIKPMKANWERWNYVMFLLNMPNKKSKQKDYNKRSSKLIKVDSRDEDRETLNQLKNLK